MTETFYWLTTPGIIDSFADPVKWASGLPFLASSIEYPALLLDQSWLHVILIACLVLFNGFFVAVEVALIKLRPAQLDEAEGIDDASVDRTRIILKELDKYIPACKFGASISGILLGAISIPYLVLKLLPLVKKFEFVSKQMDLWTSFIIAFGITLALLVVLGKVIPNSIGFRRELQVSTRCSRLLHVFYLAFAAPIWALTKFSNWFMSTVMRIEPASERESDHSAEDLKIFVEETGEDAVTETEKEILINTLELNDLKARDIVTPRQEVIALDLNDPFEVNLEKAVGSKHTRFPLINEHLDDTIGQIHIKDLIQLMQDKDSNPNLKKAKREILHVSEDIALDELLKTFLEKHAHIALVIDEYGGAHGIVMLDELLELLVGDIQDEFEGADEEEVFTKISEDEFVVAANLPLHELDDLVPELDLEDPDVSTVGGYVTTVIGHHPKVGEKTEIEGFDVRVTRADERKVLEVRFKRILDEEIEAAEAIRIGKKLAAG